MEPPSPPLLEGTKPTLGGEGDRSLLTIVDEANGHVAPDLTSFILEGLEEVWLGVKRDFRLTASRTVSQRKITKYVGGNWSVVWRNRLSSNLPSSYKSFNLQRVGLDTAVFEHTFEKEGDYEIRVYITGKEIVGSPFPFRVTNPSSDQLTKYQLLSKFVLPHANDEHTLTSIDGFFALYEDAHLRKDLVAEEYREVILSMISDFTSGRRIPSPRPSSSDDTDSTSAPTNSESPTEVDIKLDSYIFSVNRPRIYEIKSDILSINADALFVPHNSVMKFPKTSSFQKKLLEALEAPIQVGLVNTLSTFANGKTLGFGSTLITPIRSKKILVNYLVNCVVVRLQTKGPLPITERADLKQAIFQGLEAAGAKPSIQRILVPHQISKNFFFGKNEDVVRSIIKEFLEKGNVGHLRSIVIVSKDNTPKVKRKKRLSLGGLRVRTPRPD
jgi:hypothetical protein